MKIGIGSDHSGFLLKEELKKILKNESYSIVVDVGTYTEEPIAVGIFAQKVVHGILKREFDFGILICGTGGGMSVCANRYPGIRAILCFNSLTAEIARSHNDANVLVMGSKTITLKEAIEIVNIFFSTPFLGGKYAKRLQFINEIEKDISFNKYK